MYIIEIALEDANGMYLTIQSVIKEFNLIRTGQHNTKSIDASIHDLENILEELDEALP